MQKICTYEELLNALKSLADSKYDGFNNKIVNSVYPTIGVRTPDMRAVAKAVPTEYRDGVLAEFFAQKDYFYEIITVAGFIAARKGDYIKTREYLKKLIPLFGSWAHVDTVIPSLDWVDRHTLLNDFEYLLNRDGQYEVRSYVIMLLDCVTEDMIDFVLAKIPTIRTGEYYIDMGLAWLIAECLVKFYDKTLPLIERKTFPKFIHNKAIQKARESFRIDGDKKAYLNSLKVK